MKPKPLFWIDNLTGVPQMHGDLLRLMNAVKCKESTRYAIACLNNTEGLLVSTDGRRLITLEHGLDFPDGLYWVLPSGHLMKDQSNAGNFPGYKALFDDKRDTLYSGDGRDGELESIVASLFRTGWTANLDLLLTPLRCLLKVQPSELQVQLCKTGKQWADDRPAMFTCKVSRMLYAPIKERFDMNFRMLVMPISILRQQ